MIIECRFADVSEHDMDMLFLEEFVASKEFLNIFTSKAGIIEATVVGVEVSKTDVQLGESDMTVIVETNGKRHGLLIEDKINAEAMPEQYNRYIKRGEKGKKNNDYSSFDVFIVAPEKYLNENAEAKKYPIKVKYEECIEYFEKSKDVRKDFKLAQIKKAIEKQKSSYQVIENESVTDFWNKYIAYQKKNFPDLDLTASERPRGAKSLWPEFKTNIRKLNIIHKSNAGYIDLQFFGMAAHTNELKALLNEMVNLKEKEMNICTTGKSVVVRAYAPKLDFTKLFEEQTDNVEICFTVISKMLETLKQFNVERIRYFMESF